ncbi:MAG TPA: hypothetical protein VFM44_01160 [Gemmatimonadota bacterium]|nr:hypothetical protein [Gemmatimonadota bacterium]
MASAQATQKTSRILSRFAAIVLLATAIFHATGYTDLDRAVDASDLSPFFRRALPRIWLFFSWHLIAVAGALGWASLSGSRSGRPLLTFAAILICADALFVLWVAGFFAGTVLLFAAAVCAVVAAARAPS